MIARSHYDRDTLNRFLNDEAGDAVAMSTHLESCEGCRSTLESLVSEGLTMELAGELLRPVAESDVAGLAHSSGLPCESPEAWAASATSFLEPSDHPDSLGRFARYEIMEVLGRGGMGIVMRGYDTSLNRHSAVKVLAPELASSAAARKRFSREARSAAAVVHPHVVPIQTVDEYNGLPYLVMPVVEGQSVDARVRNSGPLEVIEAVRIAAQVAEGLAAAHDQGLVHRDIKPANVLLENGVERVQITDFGLARAVDDASMTRSGVIAGTPQYMSPEQAHGDAIDHRSDLFSLGSLIYFMLTGHSPFRAETTMGVLNRIVNDAPRSIRDINSDVTDWLEQIVMKLLSKSRDDRFESAEEVAELLHGCLAHVQHPTTSALPLAVTKLAKSPSQNPPPGGEQINKPPIIKWLAAAGFACALIFAGVLIVLELNKGTLTIECEADDVPIRIIQGDEVVEKLTVTKGVKSSRIAAGDYVVEIDGEVDGIAVNDGQVSLNRGSTMVVKVASQTAADRSQGRLHQAPAQSDWDDAVDSSGRDGKVIVDVYCGDDVMPQMNSQGPNKARHLKMLSALNAIEGVTCNFRMKGQGNEIFNIIVRDPAHRLIQERSTDDGPARIRDALLAAFKEAKVEDVRWPKLDRDGVAYVEEHEAAAHLRADSPRNELEKAVGRLVLVFFQDTSRRAVPCLVLNAGNGCFAFTTGPATLVPEGVPPAIERAIVELADNSHQDAPYDNRSDKALFAYELPSDFASTSLNEVATVQTGDNVYALSIDSLNRLQSGAAHVVAVGVDRQLNLPQRTLVHEYSGLIQVDRCLPEGTPVFRDGKLVGVTLLGERFGISDAGHSWLVPASRLVELLEKLGQNPQTRGRSSKVGDAKKVDETLNLHSTGKYRRFHQRGVVDAYVDAALAGDNLDGSQADTKRTNRWVVQFADEQNLKAYARQLDFFNIELGCVFADGRIFYASTLSESPVVREARATDEERLFLSWQGSDRVKSDVRLLTQAGVPEPASGTALHVYSRETVKMMDQMESEYSATPVDQILRTYFQVTPSGSGGGYKFVVTDQKLRPVIEDVPNTTDDQQTEHALGQPQADRFE